MASMRWRQPPIYCVQDEGDSVPIAAQERMERLAGRLWNDFYDTHQDHFFKDRHWIGREWPELAQAGGERSEQGQGGFGVVEVGCGVGNAALPLLDVLTPPAPVYACDFSETAIGILRRAPAALRSRGRLRAFVADAARPGALLQGSHAGDFPPIARHSLAAATLVFALSAMSPAAMVAAVDNVRSVLSESGGRAFVRDYGVGDMASARLAGRSTPRRLHAWIPAASAAAAPAAAAGAAGTEKEKESRGAGGDGEAAAALMSGGEFFARGDGTRAFYFSEAGLRRLFESRGFKTEALGTVHMVKENRATRERMPRRWVQAVFRLGGEATRRGEAGEGGVGGEGEGGSPRAAGALARLTRTTATTATTTTSETAPRCSSSSRADGGGGGGGGGEGERAAPPPSSSSSSSSTRERASRYRPEWQDSDEDGDDGDDGEEGEEEEEEGGEKEGEERKANGKGEKASSPASSAAADEEETARAAARLFRTVLVDSTATSSSKAPAAETGTSTTAPTPLCLEAHEVDVGPPLGGVSFSAAPAELRSTLLHTGLLTWPAAPALARILLDPGLAASVSSSSSSSSSRSSSCSSSSFSSSLSLLELGAGGSPLVALAAARSRCGFRRVVATDGSPRALRLLSANLASNSHLVIAERLRVRLLPWGDARAAKSAVEAAAPAAGPVPAGKGKRFDVVVGADTLYSVAALPRLMATIAATLDRSSSSSLAVLCYQERRVRVAEAEAAAREAGLEVVAAGGPPPWRAAAGRAGVGEGRLLRLLCLRHASSWNE